MATLILILLDCFVKGMEGHTLLKRPGENTIYYIMVCIPHPGQLAEV